MLLFAMAKRLIFPLSRYATALPKGEPIIASPFWRGGTEGDGEGRPLTRNDVCLRQVMLLRNDVVPSAQ